MADAPLATFSPCGRYRYSLRRACDGLLVNMRGEALEADDQVTWIMLNPSTADAHLDDPTIRRCRDFSERWGYRAMEVVNAYAWRSTDPGGLWTAEDPVGPDNDQAILDACCRADLIVCAWGKNIRPDRRDRMAALFSALCDVHSGCSMPPGMFTALKLNNDGSPAHPLYLANALMPQPFTLEAARG